MNLFLQMWFRIVISECSTSFVVAVVGGDGDGDCVVAFHNSTFILLGMYQWTY